MIELGYALSSEEHGPKNAGGKGKPRYGQVTVCWAESEEDVAGKVACGPDPTRHVEAVREYEAAGIDHVYVHQIGLDQEGFLRLYEREVLPHVAVGAPAAAVR